MPDASGAVMDKPMQNRLKVAERLLFAIAAIITILAGLHELSFWPF